MLHIHLLGHLRVTWNGEVVRFGGLPRTLPLWALLLLNYRQPLGRERLAYTLWPESSESQALANLRRHLYDLKQTLPPAPAGQPWILSENKLVQWNPASPFWLDIAEFERLCAGKEAANRLESSSQAADLYTGDLLADSYEDWIFPERERLRGLYFEQLRYLARHRQELGDYPGAVHSARRLLAADPLNEDAARQLIRLLYAAGDRPGALYEYQLFEQKLHNELGIPPMPETLLLAQQIRTESDPRLLNPPVATQATAPRTTGNSGPAVGTGAAQRHSLPVPLTSFVGRTEELGLLLEMLQNPDGPRLVTLTGPGGAGKTRLALQALNSLLQQTAAGGSTKFPDGIFYLSLAALEDPDLVGSTLAAALGVRESAGRPPAQSIEQYLQPKQFLLALDNFEQLLEATGLLATLLETCPGLHLLVTSRIALRLVGEQELPLPPLPLPLLDPLPPLAELERTPAVALFIARARAAYPIFKLTQENAAAVAAICRLLDGLPLAIELAAAHLRHWPPQAMLAQLEGGGPGKLVGPGKLGIEFLESPARNQPARHRTLRQAIDWSYNLLQAEEQRLFARLSVFAGSFTLQAAVQILSQSGLPPAGSDAYRLAAEITALADQSMLRQAETDPLTQTPRFGMLLTLREYAREKLASADGPDQPRAELAAMQRSHAAYYSTLAAQADRSLRGPEQLAWLQMLNTELDNLRSALAWATQNNQAEPAQRLAAGLWRFWEMSGHISEGRRWLELALAAEPAADSEPSIWRARAEHAAGHLAHWQGDLTASAEHYRRAIQQARACGDEAAAARSAAGLATYEDDPQAALAVLADSLKTARQNQDPAGAATALHRIGQVAYYQDDLSGARRPWEECLAIYRSMSDTWGITQVLNNLGVIAQSAGETATARGYHTESLALRRQFGFKPGIAQSLHNLGWTLASLGETQAALENFRESLRLRWELGTRSGVVEGLEALGCMAARRDQAERAAFLLSAAGTLRQSIGSSLDSFQRAQLEQSLQTIRQTLSANAFDTAWASGQAATLEKAIGAALESWA